MKVYKWFALILVTAVLLAACAPVTPGNMVETPAVETATPLPPTPVENQIPAPNAVLIAQKMLAERLGISPEEVTIREIEQAQWPNGCLGVENPDEMCSEAIVDGYRAILEAQGKTYEYRTDLEGMQVRPAPSGDQAAGDGTGEVTPEPVDETNLPGAVLSARQVLAQQLGVNFDQINVVSVEKVEWSDSCLGVNKIGQMCAQVLTPGYKARFEVDGKQYEFHTDEEGGAVVLAMAPLPRVTEKIIVWEQTEAGVCSRVEVSQAALAFGPCGGTMMQGRLLPERLEELKLLITTYAPFMGGTTAGTVDFEGEGKQAATEAEQRSIAEWSRLVYQEAQSGRSGASWGLIFAWHQEGGIAGQCADVSVSRTGWYDATSCRSNQPEDLAHHRLNADQLAQVYAWVDRYQAFEYAFTDPAVADAMTTRLVFTGAGQEQPTGQQQEEILQFASQLFTQASQ